MNNEIKEIIEYFKDDIDFLEVELKHPEFKGRYITIRDKECEYLRKLLDYITNLQEEKDSLDDYNRHLHNELKDYKSRIDKAIKYIEENAYIDYNPTLDGSEDDSYNILPRSLVLYNEELDRFLEILDKENK